jgi:hypothetical protein
MRTVLLRLFLTALLVLSGRNGACAEGYYSDASFSQLKNWAKGRVDISAGTDTTNNYVSAYGAVVVALTNSLRDTGWRLRASASGSYGGHEAFYATTKLYRMKDHDRRGAHEFAITAHKISHIYEQQAEAMAGYQFNLRDIWLKLYGGIHYKHRTARSKADPVTVFPLNQNDIVRGYDISRFELTSEYGRDARAAIGGKVLAEVWLPLGKETWGTLDASLSTIDLEFTATARLGYRVQQRLLFWELPASIGPEVTASSNSNVDTLRLGTFTRMDLWGQELTASSGVTGNYRDPAGAYATLGLYSKF